MDFDDPFVKFLSKVVLALVAFSLLAIGMIGLSAVIDWYQTSEAGPGNPIIVKLAKLLPSLSGAETSELVSIVGILVSAAPLMVTPVCFRAIINKNGQKPTQYLNSFGKAFALFLLLVILVSGAAYLLIKPALWGPGHDLGTDGLLALQEWCKAALRGAVFYVSTLFGLKALK